MIGLLGFVLPGFICFFVLFLFFYKRVVKYVWNVAMISMNLKKLTVFQFIFTNCLHSLVPNCPDNGHLSLVETGSTWPINHSLSPLQLLVAVGVSWHPSALHREIPRKPSNIPFPPARSAWAMAGIPRFCVGLQKTLPRRPNGRGVCVPNTNSCSDFQASNMASFSNLRSHPHTVN